MRACTYVVYDLHIVVLTEFEPLVEALWRRPPISALILLDGLAQRSGLTTSSAIHHLQKWRPELTMIASRSTVPDRKRSDPL
jgi:hypothetical protein